MADDALTDARAGDLQPWRVAGTYVESCNCKAICPCRRINGAAGGRSTYGVCLGVLSWHVDDGGAGEVELSGLNVALALRYDDEEPGSPWDFLLYVDERGDEDQQRALTEIFSGRLGGDALEHFPWAWKPSRPLGVRPARIELDHTPRRQWLRIADAVSIRISGPVPEAATVTCVVPGHEQPGEELIAEELKVDDEPLRFEFSGNCAYAARFDYRSPDS